MGRRQQVQVLEPCRGFKNYEKGTEAGKDHSHAVGLGLTPLSIEKYPLIESRQTAQCSDGQESNGRTTPVASHTPQNQRSGGLQAQASLTKSPDDALAPLLCLLNLCKTNPRPTLLKISLVSLPVSSWVSAAALDPADSRPSVQPARPGCGDAGRATPSRG